MTTKPVVLIYVDGDSYCADHVAYAGEGEPLVITFDGGQYDKYNIAGQDDPRDSYAEDLETLQGHEAADTLREWVNEAADAWDEYMREDGE